MPGGRPTKLTPKVAERAIEAARDRRKLAALGALPGPPRQRRQQGGRGLRGA